MQIIRINDWKVEIIANEEGEDKLLPFLETLLRSPQLLKYLRDQKKAAEEENAQMLKVASGS